MTKKDYQAIVRALYNTRLTARAEDFPGLVRAVDAIADVCAADNPRFDRARFVEACETSKCKGMRE